MMTKRSASQLAFAISRTHTSTQLKVSVSNGMPMQTPPQISLELSDVLDSCRGMSANAPNAKTFRRIQPIGLVAAGCNR